MERRTALLPFAAGPLMERAARSVRLSDFAPDAQFTEGLDQLCRSIERDVQPTLLGRILLHDVVGRALVNRLLWVRERRIAPERTAGPMLPPLIVVGVPRSGTTLLHRLLALDPAARALAMWEVQRPFPPPGRDLRRVQAKVGIDVLRWAAVDLDIKHFTSGDAIEECMLLLDTSLVSFTFWVYAPVYGYAAWWLAQDKIGPYRMYREILAWLQAQTPRARFTLKAPAHTGCLDALLAAIPDAMIVQTHRDPDVVVPSMNSLFSTIHSTMTGAADRRRLGEMNAAIVQQMLQDSARHRAAGRGRIVDVGYPDLTRDPVAAIRRIYDHFGLRFTADFEARLRRALAEDHHGQRGRHTYAAEDFGQTANELRARFEAYMQPSRKDSI